ncbi:MAG TPA: type 1 glutamine amidotransferase domain-containing protein [Caulobacteraceae bacterium]|jgi:putative intracellular protease/amidase|nr:type 1 glutamine amidotransferase domain-containing protein [Caulobacteraceae bacterium]
MLETLIVVTSADRLDAEHLTGVWLDEYAIPFTALCEAGVALTVASSRGGPAPIDPKTAPDAAATARWRIALDALASTKTLAEVAGERFDAVLLPGGHGPLVDLAGDADLAALVTRLAGEGAIVAALCHGAAGLLGATGKDGLPLVRGRKLTAFTNGEETLSGLQTFVPFLLETRLRDQGAVFEHALLPTAGHVVRDGLLVTGQNPASSEALARCLIEALGERQRAALTGEPAAAPI